MSLPARHGLNPKCRRSGHLTDIAVVGVPAPYSFHPGTDLESCNRVPNWTSLKTGLEKENCSDAIWGNAGFCAVERGTVSHYPHSAD
jgi:hypothetical protein